MKRAEAEKLANQFVADAVIHYEEQAKIGQQELMHIRSYAMEWLNTGAYRRKDENRLHVLTLALRPAYEVNISRARVERDKAFPPPPFPTDRR